MISSSGSYCKFITHIFEKVMKVAVCLDKSVEDSIWQLVR